MIDKAIYSPSPHSMRYSPQSSLLENSHRHSCCHSPPRVPLHLRSRIRSATLIRRRPYRYQAIFRYHRHRARVCAGLCNSQVILSNRPHAYHLPLHKSLYIHLHQFDPASSTIGLDICSVVKARPLDLQRLYRNFLTHETTTLSASLARISALTIFRLDPPRPPGLGRPVVLIAPLSSLIPRFRPTLHLDITSIPL